MSLSFFFFRIFLLWFSLFSHRFPALITSFSLFFSTFFDQRQKSNITREIVNIIFVHCCNKILYFLLCVVLFLFWKGGRTVLPVFFFFFLFFCVFFLLFFFFFFFERLQWKKAFIFARCWIRRLEDNETINKSVSDFARCFNASFHGKFRPFYYHQQKTAFSLPSSISSFLSMIFYLQHHWIGLICWFVSSLFSHTRCFFYKKPDFLASLHVS